MMTPLDRLPRIRIIRNFLQAQIEFDIRSFVFYSPDWFDSLCSRVNEKDICVGTGIYFIALIPPRMHLCSERLLARP
jgi:hypothetical protein